MKNREIARIFSELAAILEFRGDNPFKIRAYQRASMNLEAFPRPVEELSRRELLEIPGIGADLAGKIEEYVRSGSVGVHERLRGETPLGLAAMLSVPGLGPKKALLFYEKLGISSLDELERAAREHRLAGVRGMGEKTEENILRGIASVREGRKRRPLGKVLPLAQDIVESLRRVAPIGRIEIAGSLRRRRETVKDVDLVATSPRPEEAMEAFVRLASVREVTMRGPTRSSIIVGEGLQVDLRVVEESSFGAALAYLTGSRDHNIRLREMAVRLGLKVNEYGIFRESDGFRLGGEDESDIYRLLGLPWIEPELREDAGEVEAALEGRLPELVRLEEIRGDLHVHSRWSDGAHRIEALADAARARGLSYIALTEHSPELGIARGLSPERLLEQQRAVRELNSRLSGFTILQSTEMDIRADGSLDYPDEVLRQLDLVVASVHSAFRQPAEVMTRRIIAAMQNPYVSIIGHPTGRLLGSRDPYETDMEAILKAARETGTAMEINAYPDRLDLCDRHARRAGELEVPVVISTDSHTVSEFANLHYGVSVARRGWLERKDVLNTLEAPELLQRLRRKGGGTA
jgi:DNA polymerase (family X)